MRSDREWFPNLSAVAYRACRYFLQAASDSLTWLLWVPESPVEATGSDFWFVEATGNYVHKQNSLLVASVECCTARKGQWSRLWAQCN